MLDLARVPANNGAPGSGSAALAHIPRFQHRFYAFLSYSHKDRELADWLHRELERFKVPRSLAGRLTAHGVAPKRLGPIFRDQHELAAAGDLGSEIREALASSHFLVVLCSPDSAKSRWTNAEIEAFKRTQPEAHVLAAIASGEPFASDIEGREDEECFPPALRQKYDRRGRPTAKRAEPLAADLRGEGESRRIGFLKLVAGMLGVGLDELVHRETARRHRRLGYLAAASIAGMVVTSGLAITAIQARDAARDQRREAEGLIGFMLGDLKDKLEPIGRLDALDGVGSRVLVYYQKQDMSDLPDAALSQRSKALSLMAQVTFLRGDYDAATRLYREALAGTAEAVRRSPDNPQRLFDHAQNVFWVGDLARRRGEFAEAETAYREYKRLADRMVAIAPDNLKWRIEVLYANENLGIVLMNQRRFAEAARQFRGALRPMESFASIDPEKSEYQQEIANLLGWFADAERAQGQLESAIAARRQQIAFLERLVGGKANDVGVQWRMIPAHQGLGVLLSWQGKAEQGLSEYRAALDQANRLIAIEPNNSKWRDMATSVRLELAKNLLTLGRRDEAAQEAASACQAAGALPAHDSKVARWRTLQTTCLAIQSRLALAAGADSQALSFAERSLGSARAERSGDAISDRFSVAAASRLLGDVRQRIGDTEGARAAWSAGLAQLPQESTEVPWEMRERVELLRRLGRSGEAAPIAARLAAIGYRDMS